MTGSDVQVSLTAVIVATSETHSPVVRLVQPSKRPLADQSTLPSGPFTPRLHRTLEIGLRQWVEEQTSHPLGYVEQLYTFGDRNRDPSERSGGPRGVSVGYLTLSQRPEADTLSHSEDPLWMGWYRFFPWEDWRRSRPAILDHAIMPLLAQWIEMARAPSLRAERQRRVKAAFNPDQTLWDNERVLERYELLYEAGLVSEAIRDEQAPPIYEAGYDLSFATVHADSSSVMPSLGRPMSGDHRRILSTAISRLRGKIKFRAVVFELLPDSFTLWELQKTVEGLSGTALHKQNFRRLIEQAGLVETTGAMSYGTGGRPAALFRFRPEVLLERLAPGVMTS